VGIKPGDAANLDAIFDALADGSSSTGVREVRTWSSVHPLMEAPESSPDDAKLEADRATVNAALDRIEQERQAARISSAMRSRSPT
jgi:hypothetical protein